MVSKESAVLCTRMEAKHDLLSRDADHSDLAKFRSRTDCEYIVLRGRIFECLEAAPDAITKRLAKMPNPSGRRNTASYPGKEASLDPRSMTTITPVVTEEDCFNNFMRFLNGEKSGLKVFYSSDEIREFAPIAKTMVDKLLAIGYKKQTALQLSILILYDMAMLIGIDHILSSPVWLIISYHR